MSFLKMLSRSAALTCWQSAAAENPEDPDQPETDQMNCRKDSSLSPQEMDLQRISARSSCGSGSFPWGKCKWVNGDGPFVSVSMFLSKRKDRPYVFPCFFRCLSELKNQSLVA